LAVKYFIALLSYKLRKAFAKLALDRLIKDVWVKLVKAAVLKHYFEKFRQTEFHGMAFNIPFKAEEYIEYKYGKDWRVPNKG